MEKLERHTPEALATLRIVAALLFIAHGTQKLIGFPGLPGAELPAVGSLLWAGAWMELVGGALLLAGLFTRPVAFLLSGEMAVAYWMFHAPASFYPTLNGGDAAILFSFVFLLFVFTGPGAWSLDGLRNARASNRTPRLGQVKRSERAIIYSLLQNP